MWLRPVHWRCGCAGALAMWLRRCIGDVVARSPLRDGASRGAACQGRFAALRARTSSTLDTHHLGQGRTQLRGSALTCEQHPGIPSARVVPARRWRSGDSVGRCPVKVSVGSRGSVCRCSVVAFRGTVWRILVSVGICSTTEWALDARHIRAGRQVVCRVRGWSRTAGLVAGLGRTPSCGGSGRPGVTRRSGRTPCRVTPGSGTGQARWGWVRRSPRAAESPSADSPNHPARRPLLESPELWPYFPAAPGVAASFPGRGEVCQGSNLFDPEGTRRRP